MAEQDATKLAVFDAKERYHAASGGVELVDEFGDVLVRVPRNVVIRMFCLLPPEPADG